MDYVVLLQGMGELPLEPLWGSAIGFVILFVATVGAIGLGSRSLAVGAMGAYIAFTFFAVESGIVFLETLLYVTLTLVIIGTAFKIWKLEGFEAGS